MSPEPKRAASSPWAALWTLDREIAYLNHGSFGACPRSVQAHRARLQAQLENGPVQFLARDLEARLDEARRSLGAFVGAGPDDLAFVGNATTGVNTVLRSLDFGPGDEILTTNHAYGACRCAMDFTVARTGARLVVADVPFPLHDSSEVVERVVSRVTPKTRLAVLDHVTSVTGLIFPIERLVRELRGKGVETLVDGAHAPGMVPLDLSKIGASFYTGNAHKWLCAPKGAAFLHVRRDRQAEIHPLVISHGYGHEGGRSRFLAEFDWTGSRDPTAWLSIPESIRMLGGILPGGWSELMERNHDLVLKARAILMRALDIEEPCPETMIGSIASLPLPAMAPGRKGARLDSEGLRDLLHREHRMEVFFHAWPGPSGMLTRLAAQLYNFEDQYVRLAEALREVVGR
jgi:isopenicillin-N epimerase